MMWEYVRMDGHKTFLKIAIDAEGVRCQGLEMMGVLDGGSGGRGWIISGADEWETGVSGTSSDHDVLQFDVCSCGFWIVFFSCEFLIESDFKFVPAPCRSNMFFL